MCARVGTVPNKDEHLEKAQGNEVFAASITPDNQTKTDWLLVVLFYAAVHYVEAYLARHLQVHLKSHTTRDSWVGRESNLKKIYTAYQHFKYYGYNARHEVSGFTVADTQDALGDLSKIKAHITPML